MMADLNSQVNLDDVKFDMSAVEKRDSVYTVMAVLQDIKLPDAPKGDEEVQAEESEDEAEEKAAAPAEVVIDQDEANKVQVQ